MSTLVKYQSKFKLSPERLENVLSKMKQYLSEKVDAAYIFGSAAIGEYTEDSDIDMIIVHNATQMPFIQRPLEFRELYEIYPNIDVLVYTDRELSQQLADSEIGFWKSVRLSMKQIV